MTTRQEAIEDAARSLRNFERWHRDKYGGASSRGLELAAAWTALAAVIEPEPASTHIREGDQS